MMSSEIETMCFLLKLFLRFASSRSGLTRDYFGGSYDRFLTGSHVLDHIFGVSHSSSRIRSSSSRLLDHDPLDLPTSDRFTVEWIGTEDDTVSGFKRRST